MIEDDSEIIRNKICIGAYNKLDATFSEYITENKMTYLEIFHVIDLLKLKADMNFTEQALRRVVKEEIENKTKVESEKEIDTNIYG